jgi:hypothetical protein
MRDRGITVFNLLGEVHQVLIFARAAGSAPDDQRALGRAIVDIAEPLLALLVEPRLDASGVDVDALVTLNVDVGSRRHTVAVVAGELVHADLVALGLCIDTGGESGEQRTQQEWDEASHGELWTEDRSTVKYQWGSCMDHDRDIPE